MILRSVGTFATSKCYLSLACTVLLWGDDHYHPFEGGHLVQRKDHLARPSTHCLAGSLDGQQVNTKEGVAGSLANHAVWWFGRCGWLQSKQNPKEG